MHFNLLLCQTMASLFGIIAPTPKLCIVRELSKKFLSEKFWPEWQNLGLKTGILGKFMGKSKMSGISVGNASSRLAENCNFLSRLLLFPTHDATGVKNCSLQRTVMLL